MLIHQIHAFKKAGIDDIAIVTGYKREQLEQYNLKEFYNDKWYKTNMVRSLMCAGDWLKKYRCIISYSDIIFNYNAINLLANSKYKLCLTFDPNWLQIWKLRFENPLDDAESFIIDENQNILDIGKKPTSINEIMGQYMGLLKLTPSSWKVLSNFLLKTKEYKIDKMYLTDLLQGIILSSLIKVKGLPHNHFWAEFDSSKDLKVFESLI